MGMLFVLLSLSLTAPAKDTADCDGSGSVDHIVPSSASRRDSIRDVDDLTPDYVNGPWFPLPEEHPFHPVSDVNRTHAPPSLLPLSLPYRSLPIPVPTVTVHGSPKD